jgi:hypothetical protein
LDDEEDEDDDRVNIQVDDGDDDDTRCIDLCHSFLKLSYYNDTGVMIND